METVKIPMEELAEVIKVQLEQGGRAELIVTGSSMHPLFHNRRDKVILTPRAVKRPDIILYRRDNGAYVLHRIVREKNGSFIVTGDNQWQLEDVRSVETRSLLQWMAGIIRGSTTPQRNCGINYMYVFGLASCPFADRYLLCGVVWEN